MTVGLPFCVFKLCAGAIALGSSTFAPFGYALLALGAIDGVLNLVNFASLVISGRRISGVCIAEVALRGELGLAVDVFVSFALVAIVIGFGLLSHTPRWALPIWNLAVVLNVLGAGIGRLFAAVRTTRESPALTDSVDSLQ